MKSSSFYENDISSAARAYEVFRPLGYLDVEELWGLALGPSLKILKTKMIFRGTVNSCPTHPREIFRFALLNNASALLIAHNHPSGEAEASPADLEMTKQLILAGRLIEIPLLDHLLITRNSYASFREKMWCVF